MMVSDQIRFHRELHRIQATAMGSLMRQSLMADPISPPPETIPQPSTLNLLIMSFNDELNDLALEANNQQSRSQKTILTPPPPNNNLLDLFIFLKKVLPHLPCTQKHYTSTAAACTSTRSTFSLLPAPLRTLTTTASLNSIVSHTRSSTALRLSSTITTPRHHVPPTCTAP